MNKIGLLGYGKMGSSIVDGIVNAKIFKPEEIGVYTLDKDKLNDKGYNLLNSEIELFENCDILILAVKPQTFPTIVEKVKNRSKSPRIIVSIAAGITINYLENMFGNNKYVRIMPNLGAQIGQSVSTMAISKSVLESEMLEIKNLFESIGTCEVVEEELINVLLPINGSFPAYFWYFLRSFIKASVKHGADENQCRNLISSAAIGCANLLKESSKDIDTLINDVCSYKGTTIEGVEVLNNSDFDEIIEKCSYACERRAKELEQ